MGELRNISFEEEPADVKDRVAGYWAKRADSFFDLRYRELKCDKAGRWLDEISALLPWDKSLNILDLGCGAGFFEVLLGKQGHSVTGIDLTEDMVGHTRRMIRVFGLDENRVKAVPMDAEKPDFPDGTFDVVITRNLTWTLPHPADAYQEWFRVLKTGGLLLNFDAEYAKNAHRWLKSPENIAHKDISDELKDECHEIYHMLAISSLARPVWDTAVLAQIGFSHIETDAEFGDRVYKEQDEFYMPDRMFRIAAFKE